MLGVAAKSLSGAEASQLLKTFLTLDKVGGGGLSRGGGVGLGWALLRTLLTLDRAGPPGPAGAAAGPPLLPCSPYPTL